MENKEIEKLKDDMVSCYDNVYAMLEHVCEHIRKREEALIDEVMNKFDIPSKEFSKIYEVIKETQLQIINDLEK